MTLSSRLETTKLVDAMRKGKGLGVPGLKKSKEEEEEGEERRKGRKRKGGVKKEKILFFPSSSEVSKTPSLLPS